MTEQMTNWLKDTTKGLDNDTRSVSRIFLWFAKDFGRLRDFLLAFAPTDAKPMLQKKRRLNYFAYDWNLNDATN